MDISELKRVLELDGITQKKIKTNEAYIHGISQVLFSKMKCFPMKFWGENGEELDEKTILICDSSNNAISLTKKGEAYKVSRYGTDFVFSFILKDEKGTFSYRNKKLGIEYAFSERQIMDKDSVGVQALERTIVKNVGDIKIKIRCYVKDDFIFIREFLQEGKDEAETIALYNSELLEMRSDREILDYIQAIIDENSEEIEESDDDEEIEEEMYPTVSDDSGEIYRTDIESKYGEVYYDNRYSDMQIARYNFPSGVDDFDYEDYERYLKGLQQVKRDKIQYTQNVVIQSEDMDDPEYGLFDEEEYLAYFREKLEDKREKHEFIELLYSIVSEELQTAMDLYKELDCLQDEYLKAQYMIQKFYRNLDVSGLTDLGTDR